MDETILQRIEACRPGSGDAQLAPGDDEPGRAPLVDALASHPEARQIYERVQRQDAKIRDAVQQAEPPAGLAERLLLALAVAEENAAAPLADSREAAPSAAAHRLRSRRVWIAAALAASLLLAVFGAWRFWGQPKQISLDGMVAEVTRVYHDVYQGESSPEPMRSLTSAFAIPSGTLQARGIGWRETRLLGGKAVAIDLRGGNPGVQATLLVAYANGRVPEDGVSTLPPWVPNSTTGGRCIGLWRSKDMVYALVVEGDTFAYHGFIRQRELT